jgi:cysteinyl-tRNA synthetase
MLYVRAHYRSPIDFSLELLDEAAESLDRLDRFRNRVEAGEPDPAALEQFRGFMDSDFNTAKTVSLLFDLVRDGNRLVDEGGDASALAGAVEEIVGVLGLDDASEPPSRGDGLTDEEIEDLVEQRNRAREQRSFDEADRIRDSLDEAGITLEDGPDGTRWLRR